MVVHLELSWNLLLAFSSIVLFGFNILLDHGGFPCTIYGTLESSWNLLLAFSSIVLFGFNIFLDHGGSPCTIHVLVPYDRFHSFISALCTCFSTFFIAFKLKQKKNIYIYQTLKLLNTFLDLRFSSEIDQGMYIYDIDKF